MRYTLLIDEQEVEVELVTRAGQSVARCLVQGRAVRELPVTWLGDDPFPAALVGGRVLELIPHGREGASVRGHGALARLKDDRLERRSAADAAGAAELRAPMPGRIVKVLVAPGDAVEPGSPLVVIEAMKMENELSLTRAGTVKSVLVAPGAAVERGAVLVVLG